MPVRKVTTKRTTCCGECGVGASATGASATAQLFVICGFGRRERDEFYCLFSVAFLQLIFFGGEGVQ